MWKTILALALISCFAVTVAAEDWPQFRGPTGQGHSRETNLPVHWSTNENVAFKQTIPGQGWSSPIYFSRKLFITTALPDETGFSLRAMALDGARGEMLWNTEVFHEAKDSSRIHSKNTHASATSIAEGNRLYVHFGHQGTACLDLDGKVIWRNNELRYEPVHGNGGSPALVGDALVFNCDGGRDPFIAALDKKDGHLLWKTPRITDARQTFSFSTPLLITVNDRKELISPGSNMVGGYDPADGKEIWRVRYDGYSVVPRPVFGHGLLFVCTGFDRPTVIAIRPEGQSDLTDSNVVWTVKRSAPNTPSPLLVGDELYLVADSGTATCLDARTGTTHWQERIGGNCSASPIYADGRIYVQTEDGTGVVLKAGKTFEKLATNPLNERSLASYAIADGALFIRTAEHLYRIQQ